MVDDSKEKPQDIVEGLSTNERRDHAVVEIRFIPEF